MIAGALTEPATHHDVAAECMCSTLQRCSSVQRRGGGNASRREAHLPPRPRDAAASGRIPRHEDQTGSRRGPGCRRSRRGPGCRTSQRGPSVRRRGGESFSRREAHLPPRSRDTAASGRIPRHEDHTECMHGGQRLPRRRAEEQAEEVGDCRGAIADAELADGATQRRSAGEQPDDGTRTEQRETDEHCSN